MRTCQRTGSQRSDLRWGVTGRILPAGFLSCTTTLISALLLFIGANLTSFMLHLGVPTLVKRLAKAVFSQGSLGFVATSEPNFPPPSLYSALVCITGSCRLRGCCLASNLQVPCMEGGPKATASVGGVPFTQNAMSGLPCRFGGC